MRSSAGFFSLRMAGRLAPGDVVALAQAELAGLLDRHVDVVLGGQVALDPQEAVALVAQVEQALDLDRLAGELLDVGGLVLAAAAAAAPAPVAGLVDVDLVAALGLAAVPAAAASACLGPPSPASASGGRRPRPRRASPLALPLSAAGAGAVASGTSVVPPNSISHSDGGSSSYGRRGRRGRRLASASGDSAVSAALRARRRLSASSTVASLRPLRLAAAPGLDAGQLEDELDDVGLAGARGRLGTESLGDGRELLAVFPLEGGPFEGGLLHAHRGLSPHCFQGGDLWPTCDPLVLHHGASKRTGRTSGERSASGGIGGRSVIRSDAAVPPGRTSVL